MRIRILGSGLRSGGPQSKKGRPGGHSTAVEVGLIRAPIQLFDDVIEGSVRVFTQSRLPQIATRGMEHVVYNDFAGQEQRDWSMAMVWCGRGWKVVVRAVQLAIRGDTRSVFHQT